MIGYRADLMTHLLDKVTSAEIVREQQAAPTVDVFTGLPFEQEELSDVCVCCGKPAKKMVYWGKAY